MRTASLVLLALLAPAARADVRLPAWFTDGMVLQRDAPIRVGGWADPGEGVTVTLGDDRQTAAAKPDGTWEVTLPARKAGGPHVLAVEGKNRLRLADVLIGEVWVCSGQSNMAWAVVVSKDHDREIAAADFPRIRLCTIREKRSDSPLTDTAAEWKACSPKTVSYFSAVAYFFGRKLHQNLDVPVGLVVAAVNGTRIEPWTPGDGGDLYNGMVHPLTRLPIRGVIWYQGEGNVGDGAIYAERMRALVAGWRKAWGQGDFPFYYVQLTPLNWGGKPVTQHAELWEAQSAAVKLIPKSGMVVTNDIGGHVGDAHPRNKQEVGRRLALLALGDVYGHWTQRYVGPRYETMRVEGGKIRVTFADTAGGLATRDGKPPTWFTVAGEDGQFVAAKAAIDGDSVVVWADGIEKPVAVRFAWHQAATPNLVNKAGFPVPAFRTDASRP